MLFQEVAAPKSLGKISGQGSYERLYPRVDSKCFISASKVQKNMPKRNLSGQEPQKMAWSPGMATYQDSPPSMSMSLLCGLFQQRVAPCRRRRHKGTSLTMLPRIQLQAGVCRST